MDYIFQVNTYFIHFFLSIIKKTSGKTTVTICLDFSKAFEKMDTTDGCRCVEFDCLLDFSTISRMKTIVTVQLGMVYTENGKNSKFFQLENKILEKSGNFYISTKLPCRSR